MSTNKHINRICEVIIALLLVITILFMSGSSWGLQSVQASMGYETRLFDTSSVHKIDIVMDDWDTFIENCESEEYSVCTVVIDGEKYSDIGIRAKGNTSLSSVRQKGSQRYSFKLEFDQNTSGKSYYGLDKLCLNNLIQDNTMMKDYLVYQMMADFGADAPLCSYVYITVNGEDWGLYLAVEGLEDSFLQRSYGSNTGDLYKPDSMGFGGGRGNGRNFDIENFRSSDEEKESEDAGSSEGTEKGTAEGTEKGTAEGTAEGTAKGTADTTGSTGAAGSPEAAGTQQPGSDSSYGAAPGDEMPGGGMSGGGKGFSFGGMGSDDVKLKYIDDDPDSYSNIFNNAKTEASTSDKRRLITSLKSLNEYTDLENVLDMDEVLRYFVVHNFVCNGDSYTGAMIHNYYLHESDGKLGMIPWDYNLAFGTFQAGNASESVNASIDSPVSGGDVDDRPMVGWIFSDESYTEAYHDLFSEFIDRWFSNGELAAMIGETADMIRSYVEKDPSKFCTTEDFETGVNVLTEFITLRGEAVSRQLQGDDTAVDTGDLNLSDMGSMGGGGEGGGPGQGGGFTVASMFNITDAAGNEVALSDLVEDVSVLTSLQLSDGTSVDISGTDFRTLMQIDFTKVVSVTDQDGNVTDLSEYTISVKSPSRNRWGRGAQTSEGTAQTSEGTQTSEGMQAPEGAQTSEGMQESAFPNGTYGGFQPPGQMPGEMPGEVPHGTPGSQQSSLLNNTAVLVGASFLVLAIGLLIAVKKRKTI